MNSRNELEAFLDKGYFEEGGHEPISDALWIASLETTLGRQFPALFRELVTSFQFHSFEVGPILFYANLGTGESEELSERIVRDKNILQPCLKAEFLHFAGSSSGIYDPVCFDMRKKGRKGDFPIVLLDHEELLMAGRAKVVQQIAGSFLEFIQTHSCLGQE